MQLSKQQKIQESRYEFPYHYIPSFNRRNFSQTRNLAWGYKYLSYLSFVLTELGKLEFESLLDVGCGDGRFLFESYKKFPEKQLTGVDFSKRAINHARAFNPYVKYIEGDICDKTILNDKYDVITLIDVLEHIPPKEIYSFLDALYFHLKESGKLILTVPSKNTKVRPKHYQHFGLQSLKRILWNHFEIQEYHFLNSLSLRTQIIQKLLTNRIFILNNRTLLNLFYRYYKKNLLIADSRTSERIYALCKKKKEAI